MVSLWILTLTHIFTQNSLNITSHSHAWYSQNTLRFNILPHTVRQDAYIYYFPLYLYATYSHLPHLTLDNHAKCPLVHYFTSHIIKKNAPYLLIYLTHSNKTLIFSSLPYWYAQNTPVCFTLPYTYTNRHHAD